MTESHLRYLGFEKQKDEDYDCKYHYYTLELGNDHTKFCLISNSFDKNTTEVYVEIFDYTSFKFTDFKELSNFIQILKNNLKQIMNG